MDELHGILAAYKMRMEREKPSKKKVALKASKKIKRTNQKSKSCSCSICSEDLDDEEEAQHCEKVETRNLQVQT